MTISAVADKRRRELHAAGWVDARIAEDQGVDRATIGQWRRAHGLAANSRTYEKQRSPRDPVRAAFLEERRRLVLMGLSDKDIARRQGVNSSNVRRWRISQGLPRNFANREETKGSGDGRQYLPSLDAPICGFADLSMYGVIADPTWSSWLEEMGATVW